MLLHCSLADRFDYRPDRLLATIDPGDDKNRQQCGSCDQQRSPQTKCGLVVLRP